MILFLIACAVLLIVALLFVVLPLWFKSGNYNNVLRDEANLEILRDQSAELEADLLNGLLTQDAYEQGKRELQARLLDEVKTSESPASTPRNPAKILALLLAVLLPVASVLLYIKIGNIDALLPQQQSGAAEGFGVLRSEAALQELEKKLEQQPENPDGWWVLARSYSEMQRFPDAVRAFEQLVKLVPNEAQLWASYADVYAMNNNRSLLGEPTRFLDKALELDGNNTFALALSGSAAMERGDYAAAITHWENLLNLVPSDKAEMQMIRDGIKQAREFLAKQKGGKEKLAQLSSDKGSKNPAADPAVTITGKVSISPALAGKVAQTDTLFIFARAAKGPKLPLAVLRKQVKDLPLQFTLDDSLAMQPQMGISNFDQVVVLARVSKSGNATVQSGDLEGSTGAIKTGTKGLNIVIDSVVP
ncbi:MAG: c-type cytochrome biogenesis protein CcmI [Gallionella sp.]|nr:c-type cytochrome biogenesis protein CcmI [Gallionella sp.]